MKFYYLFFVLSFFITTISKADYPSAKLNQNVCNEIQDQTDRLVPKSDFFCLAVDGGAFERALGVEDFYHGFGHWTQVRTELSPNKFLKINMRSIFYSGSSSEGYANPSGQYNLVSFKAIFPETVAGGVLSARIIDLDRQTVGAGLFVQDKESIGGLLTLDYEKYDVSIFHDSTGMFFLGDDIWNLQARFLNKNFGVGTFYFTASEQQSGLEQNRKPYHYIFSSTQINQWALKSEIGSRNDKWAGLLGLAFKDIISNFNLEASIELRSYDNGFADEISGKIEHQYVSYDQYDKVFTNSMNAFVKDDNLIIYSGLLNLKYRWSHHHRVGLFNELVRFAYREISQDNYYFYRAEYNYVPLIDREDSVTIFISNKVLTTSYSRPPTQRADYLYPLFKQFPFFGLEGNFRF